MAPLVLGYRLGMVPGSVVRACVVRIGLRGVTVEHAAHAAAAFHRDVLMHALRPAALDRIRWHQSQGDMVVVVSGAFDLILSQWCREQQLELISSELASVDGVLTGHYDGVQCVGDEKSRRVRERYDLERFPVVYAYGDTREDMSLLALAHKRYFRWKEMA